MEPTSAQLEAEFLSAYDTYSDAIFRYSLFRLSDRERALDLTQEVFMKVWKYLAGGGTILNMQAFLYTTARNLVVDEYRHRKPQESLDTLTEETGFEPSFDDTSRLIDSLDGREAVALLGQIPETYGDVLFMRFVQELSLKEMSEVLGETENTIAVRVHRGLSKLKKIFNHESRE